MKWQQDNILSFLTFSNAELSDNSTIYQAF
jgi:hypothetical protein